MLASLHLERAIDPNPPTVTPETSIQEVLPQMWAAKSSYVAVVKADHTFCGLMTEADLVSAIVTQAIALDTPIQQILPAQTVTVERDRIPDLLSARALLRQHQIRHLPILTADHKLEGTITHDHLNQILNPVDLLRLRRVEEVMDKTAVWAEVNTPLAEISQLLVRHRVSCVVIGRQVPGMARVVPLGILTEQDVIRLWSQATEDYSHQTAQAVMSTPLQQVVPATPLWQAHTQMQTHCIRKLVVVDEDNGWLAGILTQASLLQAVNPTEARFTLKTLEHIVEQHTQDLSQANQRLSQEVAARKRAKAFLQQQIARERLVRRITENIRQSLDLEAVLHTTVAEVSEFLQADRTFIYRLPHKAHPQGQVIAETCRLSQNGIALEPLLMQLDFDFYRKGRIHAIPDLHALERSNEKVRFLSYLGIRASLFAPIHVTGKFWGLLILNQCSAPRMWHKSDIDLLRQIVEQVGLAIEHSHLYAQLEAANAQLYQQASIDGLTQVMNRRRFDEYYWQTWQRLRRDQQPLSLILCDVDYFKPYNDTYGHPAGDDCLTTIAAVLKQSIRRPADAVARYGGEEFVLLLPNTDLAGATQLAEQVRRAVESQHLPHATSGVSQWVTLSLGVASCMPTEASAPDELMQQADQALYQAKEQGRNRWCTQSAQGLVPPCRATGREAIQNCARRGRGEC